MSCDFSYFSLMQVAEEYSLVSDTLDLTINYIDRDLSGNKITARGCNYSLLV
jgi:hypothetical protein